MDYSIPVISTTYRDQRYRSRLEAQWAAFFDLLEWRHEYEPFRVGSWLVDFHLPEFNALVEIKPLDYWGNWTDVWQRVSSAMKSSGRRSAVILTRAMPDRCDGIPSIGWCGLPGTGFAPKVNAYISRWFNAGSFYPSVVGSQEGISREHDGPIDTALCDAVFLRWKAAGKIISATAQANASYFVGDRP